MLKCFKAASDCTKSRSVWECQLKDCLDRCLGVFGDMTRSVKVQIWKREKYQLQDYSDRLHTTVTSNILVALAGVASWKTWAGGSPIECAIPAMFSESVSAVSDNKMLLFKIFSSKSVEFWVLCKLCRYVGYVYNLVYFENIHSERN